MTEEQFQDLCVRGAKAVLDATAHMDPMVRMAVLTGTLGAIVHALGGTREQAIDAFNSVFDDIEGGDIPGRP